MFDPPMRNNLFFFFFCLRIEWGIMGASYPLHHFCYNAPLLTRTPHGAKRPMVGAL
ncbi:hypothetical protein HanRHA438_Chr07g0323381 [Helianthus annuus]|nr:hypothetical protein HanRHA438_Chr07g0323381 [Helianthus annuus]